MALGYGICQSMMITSQNKQLLQLCSPASCRSGLWQSPEEDRLRNPSKGQDASICAVEPAWHGADLATLNTRRSTT